jgi:hypothetical protein
MTRRRACIGSFVLLLGLPGCAKSEGELRAGDRPAIEAIAAADVRASKAMADADTSARKGDLIAALDAVEQRAKPAIEGGLREVASAHPTTEWGRTKRDVLAKILEDRRAELGPYTEALRSGDAAELIRAIETQAAIERRALAAADMR